MKMITCQKCGQRCVPELPFQTFVRMTGLDWPGGRSKTVLALLKIFRIAGEPGSAEANLALQWQLRKLYIGAIVSVGFSGNWKAFLS
jgi:hypothetical protein